MPRIRNWLLAAALAAAGLAAPTPARAAPGFAIADVNVFAGPDNRYPPIATLGAGAPLEVVGCLGGWDWCDVAAPGLRGWVSAPYLQYVHGGRRLPVPQYGPRYGLPVVGFEIGPYWDRYYRDRPWYAERGRWAGPPPPPYRGGPAGWDGRRGPPDFAPGRGPDRGWDGRRDRDWERDRERERERARYEARRDERDRDRDRGRGPDRGADRGPDRGPERGVDRGPERGPDRGPPPRQAVDRNGYLPNGSRPEWDAPLGIR